MSLTIVAAVKKKLYQITSCIHIGTPKNIMINYFFDRVKHHERNTVRRWIKHQVHLRLHTQFAPPLCQALHWDESPFCKLIREWCKDERATSWKEWNWDWRTCNLSRIGSAETEGLEKLVKPRPSEWGVRKTTCKLQP